MAVAKYIQDLLYRYECVILPGFGAFITQQQSARIDAQTQTLYPPKKSVSFNRHLDKNDGLLANHMVEVERISYDRAVDQIALFVEDLHSVLKDRQQAELENIGTISLSEDGKIQFEPAASRNFLKEAFGLESMKSPEISRVERTIPVLEKQEIPDTEETEKGSSFNWLKYAAVGLLAVGLSGAAGMNMYKNQVNEHNLAEQQKAASRLETQIQQATFVIDNPLPAVTLKVSRQPGKYHIVAGAFRLEENAAKKVNQLRSEGYLARQIGANRFGLHQVVYSSHEGRLEALRTLREIKRDNPSAWLLVQEL